MSIKCDVLIVGAGIAGSTCASVLNKLGINDFILLERSKEIGLSHSQKIDFAEDKGLKKLLNKYNLPVLKETNVSRWFAPNYEMFEFKSKINDIWFKRGDKNSYENIVLKNLDVMTNTDVVNIEKGIVTAVNKTKNKKSTYEPKSIIIASGNSLPYFNKDKKNMIIQPLYANGFVFDYLNIDPDIPHIFFDNNVSNGSYLFMVQDSTEKFGYLAYAGTYNKLVSIKDLEKNKIIKNAISKANIIKPIHGTVYAGKQCSLTYDNMLFVGDAANLMDPFLSYGITNSIKSGIFAAEAIANNDNMIKQYQSAINMDISNELKKQLKMRNFFNKLDNEDMNSIIKLLNTLNKDGDIEKLLDNPLKLIIRLTPYIIKQIRILETLFKGLRCMI